ncbi:hypothetical protein [Macrococcoides caseolyticum]|uniref:hypothetical protein n=1 Tax=Macrococcoides caseolyticum TaxID=69966 RepID=UPI000C33AE6A|nr:hypothetical protein [Macrococcus caseolyticus]PKE17397.1 hypothetical protein CW718_04545 [Macrococcus caseolyticus]PKE68336.1 hypothetical protein CW663_03260 [Macrococcus caseolyticus]
MASCERKALKNYIKNYHKVHKLIDVDDLDISDNDFFNIESDTGMSFDAIVQQYTQISDVAGINNIMDKVLRVGTEKEIHIFFMMLQGRTVKDMSKVFDRGRSTMQKNIDRLLDKIIEG